MTTYLAHKDDEYKRKYQKYQNDPNSVFVLCECCGAALTNKSIKRHMESIHSKGDRVRAHQCDVCGKKFLYETNLKRHLFIHTGVRFKCSFCDKTYKQDWNRQVHEKTHLNPGPSATTVRKPLRRNAQLSNRSVDCKICDLWEDCQKCISIPTCQATHERENTRMFLLLGKVLLQVCVGGSYEEAHKGEAYTVSILRPHIPPLRGQDKP
ncbi:putative zinc finger protein [Apostichopus japonicus]|uniref:Putative zinc finger protein n=1 Tax=Stichopus japonicus TaxID=307972 RepID=A0A2G8K1D1_STIJA|nr:putative zinc finger protein [Apostichopus japonicus]